MQKLMTLFLSRLFFCRYESKAKKIAKEKADLLPAGITKQVWEKMKEEQKKLSNPGATVAAATGAKKKTGEKKKKVHGHSVDHEQFEINEPVIGNESAFLPSGGGVITVTAAVAGGPIKSKFKDKSQPKSESDKSAATKKSNTSAKNPANNAVVEEWVTMGKPKKGTSVSQQTVPVKTTKTAPSAKKSQPTATRNSNNDSAPAAPRRDPATDMLLDSALDAETETSASTGAGGSGNTEKQQLVKKIKKLKSKLKEAETLKQRSDAGEKLDESQVSKAHKLGQFAKEMQTLQKQLQTLTVQS